MNDGLRIVITIALFAIIFLPFYRYFDRQEERVRREWPDGWKKKLFLMRWDTTADSQERPQKDP